MKPFSAFTMIAALALLAAPTLASSVLSATPVVATEPASPSITLSPLLVDDEPWHTQYSPLLSYTYAEVSYLNSEVGDFEDDATGWKVAASMDITARMRGFISVADSELSEGGSDRSETDLMFGVGFHAPLAEGLDWTFDLAYMDDDTRRQVGAGASFDFGMRWRPTQLIELGGGVMYHLYDDLDDTNLDADAIGFRGEGHLWLKDNMSVFARFETMESELDDGDSADRTNLQLGLRFNF